MKKGIVKIVLLISIVVVIIMVFLGIRNEFRIREYSSQLNIAIQENDIFQIRKIIQEEPRCINCFPTMAPWFLQMILEMPVKCYPLQTACLWGNYDVVKILLENGADCNLVGKGIAQSKSALSCTVVSGSDESEKIIQLLLQHGADKDYVDERGKTAYDYAVESNSVVFQKLLK